MSRLYDTDFAAWARDTVQLLRERRFEEIDLEALIEEVEGLARADEHAIRSYLERLMEHLLKLTYASNVDFERDQRGWRISARNARIKLLQRTEQVPSLRSYPEQIVDSAYDVARYEAARVIDLDHLPDRCPWTMGLMLNADWEPLRQPANTEPAAES
jgi:hypothetical protein